MWERKILKKNAKKSLKAHYWKFVVICLVAAYITGAYSYNGSVNLFVAYDKEENADDAVQTNMQDNRVNASKVLGELFGVKEGEQKFTRGVFANVFNNITASGSFVFGILNSLNEGLFKGKIVMGIIQLFGALIGVLFWFFIQNMFKVCQSRLFLEGATYSQLSLERMLLLARIRKWGHVAMILFFKWLYTALWSLTVVGGIIKHYSYKMVPYIVAENPAVTKKEAFQMSRKMMQGNKWGAFVLDLSFFGWTILSACTIGVLGLFFLNPYTAATETQLYLNLREKRRAENEADRSILNDAYIGLHPMLPAGATELPAAYPAQCFSIANHKKRVWITVDYRRDYSIWSLILLFFTFSFIGWLWEVSLHLSTDGFVNRGVMQGPWLPIYGSGGVLVLVLLKKVREHKLLTFFMTVFICGILEYGTSWFLEVTKGMKWWDYSGYLLNINGRVCAEGLLVFGLGGCAFIYFAAPVFDELYRKIPLKRQIIICVLLLAIFFADHLYSREHPNTGKGITDYDQKAAVHRIVRGHKPKEIIRKL